ncbi:MAG: iron-sulfur cluster assembly accessory protein [Proteobacteria bacterium]|nr:iron-sulfur cluster assembly accessory protein [Pseudomonadota bacterium]
MKAPLLLTPAAIKRIKFLLSQREKPSAGIRLTLKTKGCSGLSYSLEYVDTVQPLDEVLEVNDLKVMIDPKAIMFLLGSEMDYVEEKMQSGFVFRNPNEKGRCGCGKSFRV